MRRLAFVAIMCPALLAAQGIRITGVTTVQLIELRQLVIDSLPSYFVSGTGDWRTTPEGVPALCAPASAFCTFERSGDRLSAAPILQDLTFAGWGWQEGLSFHANVRVRTQVGGTELLYPRGDDHFQVLDGYAELTRSTWRARVGRQWITSGLGMYAFDGANALWHHDALSVEGWSGRALVAGLEEPYTSSQLAAVDNLPPPENGYIFGGRARYRPNPLSAATLTYQRVLLSDRSGLYAERASLDASSRQFGLSADLGLNYDFSTGDWSEARLRIGTGLGHVVAYSLEARHSRPYFELWTIWGAFSPVAFDEARAVVDWTALGSPFTVSLRGAYRTYADAGTAVAGVRTNGWRAGGDIRWLGTGPFSAFGTYDVDIGSGASGTDVLTGVRWEKSNDLSFGAGLSANQTIYEFRVGTGRIYGAAFDAAVRIAADVRIVGDVAFYQHTLTNGAAGPDWTQHRATLRFEWTMGRDPGMPAGRPQ